MHGKVAPGGLLLPEGPGLETPGGWGSITRAELFLLFVRFLLPWQMDLG